MNDFAVRITYPYETVLRIIAKWSTHCQKIACYEHDDDGANRIHCHLHLEGVRVTSKRLAQLANEVAPMTIPQQDKRASSMLSFRSKEYDRNIAGYAYLTKGKYDAKYLQGFTKEESDTWKAAWVTPEHHEKRTIWRVLYEQFLVWWNDKENRLDVSNEITYEQVSSRSWKFLFSKHGRIWPPQAKTERQFLINSFCMNEGISLPKDHKF